ncbi:MAG: hypothetical protein LBS36_05145 [Oscillospiraceae bacterium]|nr:hypothetical protein [Oscillospiraceae bacterium]
MAGYMLSDSAYNFELFEDAPSAKPNVRKKTEAERRREQIRLYEKKQQPKAKAEPKAEPKAQAKAAPVTGSWVRSVQLILLCAVLFLPICSFINARRQLDELSKQIDKQKAMITEERSESVRLSAEVNSRMSINKIEDYAANVLGMVKLTPYNVQYYDFSGADKVVLSGGKSVSGEEETSFLSKLLSYFS